MAAPARGPRSLRQSSQAKCEVVNMVDVVLIGLVGFVSAQLAALHTGISVQAWMVSKLAKILAPNLAGTEALQRALKKDRLLGPAMPSKRLLKRLHFSDAAWSTGRVFTVEPRATRISDTRLLYLHGSAYVFDLHKTQWSLVWGLVKRTNAKMHIPIYPLAPEHSWKDGFEMVKRTYLQVVEECRAENIVIVGDSAGGGMAMLLAQHLRDNSLPMPAGIVMFSPWLDLSVSGLDQPMLETQDPALNIAFLRSAAEMWAKEIDAADPRVSPLFGSHDDLPPMILFTGTRDILDSDARRLSQVTDKIITRRYQEMMHVWPAAPIPEGRQALNEAAEFINSSVSNAKNAKYSKANQGV